MNTKIVPQGERASMMTPTGGGGGAALVPSSIQDVINVANLMASSGFAVPKHLRSNPGACLAVAMRAFRWDMEPFGVAEKTYLVNDIISYESTIIAAVINTRAGLARRLSIQFDGAGTALRCRVTGTFPDGSEQTYESPALGEITTKNSPLWKSDPRQQLGYYSVRAWGRRFVPEVLLGVYDPDEAAEMRDVTPPPAVGLSDRLRARTAAPTQGFITTHGASETPASGHASARNEVPLAHDADGVVMDAEILSEPEALDGEFETGPLIPLPIEDAAAYADALIRMGSPETLRKAHDQWVAGLGGSWPGEYQEQHVAAMRDVYRVHSDRIKGKVETADARTFAEETIAALYGQ